MSVVAPPPEPPRADELELLIREARARQRRRWFGSSVAVVLLAGAAFLAYSITGGAGSRTSTTGGSTPAVRSGNACGVRGVGGRILDESGRTVYREPGRFRPSEATLPTIRCSSATVWAVWDNGAAMNQEAYLGARSLDGGRTWQLVFTEGMMGPKAPHELDSYLGPWTVTRHAAFFVGYCPACGRQPTVSLWVTRDGGRRFRHYEVARLDGYWPSSVRAAGSRVTITGDRDGRRLAATVHVG